MSEEKNSVESLWRNFTVEIQGLGLEKVTLKGFQQIKTFVEKEFEFWNTMKNRPDFANRHHNHFNTIRNRLDQLGSQVSTLRNRQYNQESKDILNKLRSNEIPVLGEKAWPIVFSRTPQAEFLSDQIKINPETAQAGT